MAQTLIGTQQAGAGKEASLAGTSAAILRGLQQCSERANFRFVVNVAATGAFRLNYLFTPDGGTTWLIGQQVASAAVTVDGGTSGYTQNASLNVHLGYMFKIEIYNPGGGTIDYGFEVREYC